MMTVLVTGGAGFIGSHVVDLLIDNGYNVVIVDNLSSGNNKNLNKKAIFYEADTTSDDLDEIFRKHNISYVFHFAAQVSVASSLKFPDIDATQNIVGSIKILKLCKKYGIKKIILSSTAAVYGKPEYLPVDEAHSLECLSCYGLSKYTMEQYTKLLDVNHIIFRFANVYGPRQTAHGEAGVVAIFADKMRKNEQITIDDDGEQTRDFVYVEDVAKACLAAIQNNITNTIINVSTARPTTINELFNIMSRLFNYKLEPIHGQKRVGDIRHSYLCNKRCIEKLQFTPSVTLEVGLKNLV